MFKLFRVLLSSLLLTGLFASPAQAEDGWNHTLVPLYLWGTGVEGTAQLGPVSAPVSIEFEDALDNLDMAFSFHYEGNKGQWGVLADMYYLSLQPRSTLPNGLSTSVDLTNTIYELGGIYRPASTPAIELLFGLRALDLELQAGVGPGGAKRTLVNENWADAFVGLRAVAALSDRVNFTFRGDIGTGASDLVTNASLFLDYRFNKTVALMGGYRWLSYDYEDGEGRDHFAYDVTYEGPAIALRFDW